MRSYLLVIVSAVCLGLLFVGYWAMQPSQISAKAFEGGGGGVPSTRPSHSSENLSGLRPGDKIWLRNYDDRLQLASEFGADKYLPQRDGTINVTAPVARFYLANHQHLEIQGVTGNILVKDPPDLGHAGGGGFGPSSPPSRGRLDDVTVVLVNETPARGEKPEVLVMRTHDCVFDNETYRISTEGYRDENGTLVADDQVPVHVTGKFDMEGRGLTVRWNDNDGRIELLEIAHGEWLRINDPGDFSADSGEHKKRKPAAANGHAVAAPSAGPLPDMLAARDKDSAGQVITSHPDVVRHSRAKTRPAGRSSHGSSAPVTYDATFYDNVHVTQADADPAAGDDVDIRAERMDVDFQMKPSGGGASTRPASGPATAATPALSIPALKPANDPPASPDSAAPTQPATAGTAPAARPQPIYIRWTGVMRMTPLDGDPPAPISSGNAEITLVGAPVTIHRVEPRQGGADDVRCGSVLYQTLGQDALLSATESFPRVLVVKHPPAQARQQAATRIESAGAIRYSRALEQIAMTGVGAADVPLEPTADDKHPLMHAAWTERARFDLLGGTDGSEAGGIDKARLEGNVDVRHPRLALRSQSLDLFFEKLPRATTRPATRPAGPTGQTQVADSSGSVLRQAIATTGVYCQLEGADRKKQNIECDRLVLDNEHAGGRVYPRHVNAAGAVHAYGEDDLRAGYVDLFLVPAPAGPTTRKSKPEKTDVPADDAVRVQLEKLLARDAVVAKGKDGSTATGDELRVEGEGVRQRTFLSGSHEARMIDAKGNVIAGPLIEFDNGQGKAHVIGAGSLHLLPPATTQPAERATASKTGAPTAAAAASATPKTSDAAPPATQPATPVDVTFTTGLDFDGAANRIDVNGNVLAKSIDRKGFVDTASGARLHIDLRRKPQPATRPTTRLAAATQPAHKTGASDAGTQGDLFKDKEVVALTFEQDAKLLSTLADASGGIEQQMELTGPTIVIREISDDGRPARSVSVPKPGKMLVRDHRPPQKQAPEKQGAGDSGGRGATAIQWQQSFFYAEALRRADIDGSVVVVHRDEDPASPPLRIDADHVTAWFEPAGKKTGADAPESQLALKYLRAEGRRVVVTRDTQQMIARQIDYDPARHLMVARGTSQNPVYFDNGPASHATADAVEWDTLTWNPKFTNAVFDDRPVAPGVQSGRKKSLQRSTQP